MRRAKIWSNKTKLTTLKYIIFALTLFLNWWFFQTIFSIWDGSLKNIFEHFIHQSEREAHSIIENRYLLLISLCYTKLCLIGGLHFVRESYSGLKEK